MPRQLGFRVSIRKDIGEEGEIEICQYAELDLLENHEKGKLKVITELMDELFPGHAETENYKKRLRDLET